MSEEQRSHGRGRGGRGCWGPPGGGQFERMREAMIDNRDSFDRNLSKLSPEAQKYAIQIREIVEDRSKNGEMCRDEIRAIKQGVSQDIRDELDDHKHRIMREFRRERGDGEEGGRRSRSRPRRND
ncbi:hypothetical protein PRIPAC_75259 [Pristionchus pacificus]|uniref:Uncharacterized protein n=1 Tax=Pristionchus pacificus TaxID=54126 RepID=A0A2A6CFY6_PRIPA|nr:hypothetical protein PRIPAC_75259 [Pristionchus pacificus]|eukprot:PDM77124.1 hypothetical protein PRIPAC_43036 [Pristionchus pacificus]